MTAPPVASVRQPAVGFIFVTSALIVLGWGIISPVLPGLITEFEGGDAAAGAHMYGWILGSFAVMQFLGAPLLGVLSDRFGRRKVILMTLAGSFIVLLLILPHLTVLLVSFVPEGTWTTEIIPPVYSGENYQLIFGRREMLRPVMNSLVMSTWATIANVVFSLAASALRERQELHGRQQRQLALGADSPGD